MVERAPGSSLIDGPARVPNRLRQLSTCTATTGECPMLISAERDLASWLAEVELSSAKAVPKWTLEVLEKIELSGGRVFEVTAGDIILLWRVGFDTFTTQSWFPQYFEYTYGIDAAFDLRMLVEAGFVEVESAADSLDLVTARRYVKPRRMRA